jgi:hypothetical protein
MQNSWLRSRNKQRCQLLSKKIKTKREKLVELVNNLRVEKSE